MDYRGKPLSDYTTEQLSAILKYMSDQEQVREEASKHEKFTRTDGKAMPFPTPNPNFLNLKSEIEKEIESRTKKEWK